MKNQIKFLTLSIYLVVLAMIVLLQSCHKELDVENLNNPDSERAYENSNDVFNIAADGFYNWFMTMNSSISPRMAMWVAADQGTCSWANSGMFDLSREPRVPFNNDVSYTYASIFETYYADMYGTLSLMNKVLDKTNEGMIFGYNGKDTKMIRAYSHFIQGITLGYLGLVYDQAYITTENVDQYTATLKPYSEVIDTAIACLEKSIAICDKSNFDLPIEWINGNKYDEDELAELSRSFIARLMVYKARNAEQNAKTDWAKVLTMTTKGMKKSMAPYMDNVKWICWYRHYTTARTGWARIDSRIINLLDTDYPSRFPSNGINPIPASSNDKRLESDFRYVANNNMKPERGYEHFSNYEFARYKYTTAADGVDYIQSFPLVENDLFKAEAHARLGNLTEAIEIINKGTRTKRGFLTPLPNNSTKEQVLNTIFYERDIELIETGFGTPFFDMRRRDYLQKGTVLHFPVPGKELMLAGLSLYSFGGVTNADGINTSNGGWDK
jgi:hypothetical protein